jgi:hypothetical protein
MTKLSESEKGSKLDTLPEEKSHHSPSQIQPPTAIPTIQTTSAEPYRRVYPEWKPSTTLDKTDVVGTIETLAGMTCRFCVVLVEKNANHYKFSVIFRCANSCSR